jgi:hypothetical protein
MCLLTTTWSAETERKRMISHSSAARGSVMAATVGLTIFFVAGCSSSSSSPSASPTAASTSASESATATGNPTYTPSSLCSEQAILASVPSGASMVKYNCATVGGVEWAAVKVNPGGTVFFLQAKNGKWADTIMGSDFCGTANAGMPQVLLDYCTAPTPKESKSSASPKPTKS